MGTIIEGHDAEYSERIKLGGLDDMEQEESEKELISRFFAALQNCEDFVDNYLIENKNE